MPILAVSVSTWNLVLRREGVLTTFPPPAKPPWFAGIQIVGRHSSTRDNQLMTPGHCVVTVYGWF